jgi:hypothetical protein
MTAARGAARLGEPSAPVRQTCSRGGKGALVKAMLVLASLLSLPACTVEQAYGTAQAWQRNQCNKLPDKADVDRCLSKADTSYESYKRQTEPERR